jgi:histidinol-phosphate aminotransferase
MTRRAQCHDLRDLAPAIHGGPDIGELRRLGMDPANVLDFSVCTNPFGPSPRVRAALADIRLDCYPDRGAIELRAALADSLGVVPACILPGNGVSELLGLLAMTVLRPGDRTLIVAPTYSEYARVAILAGTTVQLRQARARDRFAIPLEEIERALRDDAPDVVFLCNPNNPTGQALLPDAIIGCARRYEQTLFVLDEAYQPFAAGIPSAVTCAAENLLVLRSLTKDHALAGLRLGCTVGGSQLIARLARAQPPWSVNALAQAAGVASLRDREHLARSLEQLAQATTHLRTGLLELGLSPLPSTAHFFLLEVGDAAAVRLALLHRGILVRDCTSFGLPAYLRLASRRPEENDILLSTLREVLP